MVKKPTTIRNGGAVITRGVYTRLSPNRKTYLLAGIGGADRDRRRRKRPLLPAAEQSEGPQARFGKVHPKKTGRGPGRRDNLQTAPTDGTSRADVAGSVLVEHDRDHQRRPEVDGAEIKQRSGHTGGRAPSARHPPPPPPPPPSPP